ncbi:MAG: DASH family cryptochrome [Pseudomonadota bacterium]
MRTIYWFRNDLRLHDNPGLLQQQDADALLLVYIWPKHRPWCNTVGMGAQRSRFLRESLMALDDKLKKTGQRLLVLEGAAENLLQPLVDRLNADQVVTSTVAGTYERHTIEHLEKNLSVPVRQLRGNCLLDETEPHFPLNAMPTRFALFCEQLKNIASLPPIKTADSLPAAPNWQWDSRWRNTESAPIALPLRGGEQQGLDRLHNWVFGQQCILEYAKTRRCLDGLSGSSTLSPWLANGCLSVRTVLSEIRRFEFEHIRNESTEYLCQELLWREFLYWRATFNDQALFQAGGAKKQIRRCIFEPRNFARWCKGDTNEPLINALMNQLNMTGWMSNRGRQIAASYLINEYAIDWRFGAAYFEKQLIDYDVASNYGNWQYLAGVGADPRGGQHFNIHNQSKEHELEDVFTEKWQGFKPAQPEFITDAADWPIEPD